MTTTSPYGERSQIRFYVQPSHIDGLAVLDREKSVMVISSFGDTSQEALRSLLRVSAALNAATATRRSMYATDCFKAVPDVLAWRVIEYLSYLCLGRAYA